MRVIPIEKRRRVTRRAIALAVVGIAISVLVYRNADPDPEDPFGYSGAETKVYLLQMEKIGGKANVAAAEFHDWFVGLWHGQNLGWTLGVISVVGAFLYWFIALHHVPAPPERPSTLDES